MATPDQLAAIRDQLRAEVRREIRAETAATAAATPDAILRKPEVPAFNKEHIEIWIKRTENAYTRAGITEASDKFAWLESKFPVRANAKIDEFLYGEATTANWNAFLAYLRKEHGPTKQQRASIILDGFKRDGRRPSQYAAALIDKTKEISIDDIRKEMLLREMPTEIRRMLQERIEGLEFQKAAEIADSYFDQDGRPRFTNNQTSVNEVAEPEHHSTPTDDDSINAVKRFPQNRQFGQPSKPWGRPPPQRGAPSKPPERTNNSQPKSSIKPSGLCRFHEKYQDDAFSCEYGCKRFHERRSWGNAKAGRK